MGFFYNNEVAGPGVSKHERKKPFVRFWSLFFAKSGTFIKINLIYFLFCLPIVTIGPATAAMTAMMRNIYLEQPQFVFHDFKALFKKNFKQSVFIGLLDVCAIAGAVLSLIYYPQIPEEDSSLKLAFIFSTVAEVVFLMMNFYIYPQIVALDLKLPQIVRNSLILICANPLGDIIALACFVGYVTLFFNFPLIILLLMPCVPLAWLAFISFFCCYPAVQKHLINPYYEKTGEKNPEIPEWLEEDDSLFKDSGGDDRPLQKQEKKKSKKVIK